jgi:hypothetical protein
MSKKQDKQTKIVRKYHKLVRKNLGFAWTIHSNLTMMLYDAGVDHLVASERSAELLKRWFGVDVTATSYWSESEHTKDSQACHTSTNQSPFQTQLVSIPDYLCLGSQINCCVHPRPSEAVQIVVGPSEVTGENKSYNINELSQIIVL